jgi:peptidoglycan-associated lipoprotein
MSFKVVGFKAVTLAAAMFLVAACETPVEQSSQSTGTGAASQTAAPSTAPAPTTSVQKVLPGSQEDLVLNVGDRVFFDFDKSDLKPEARATIERWAAWLKQYPDVTVTIEGHCDERGTREYNLGLGERRSNSAFNYLVALGVNADRIGTISYGKERPVCVSSNEGCWEQNRRGVLIVN